MLDVFFGVASAVCVGTAVVFVFLWFRVGRFGPGGSAVLWRLADAACLAGVAAFLAVLGELLLAAR